MGSRPAVIQNESVVPSERESIAELQTPGTRILRGLTNLAADAKGQCAHSIRVVKREASKSWECRRFELESLVLRHYDFRQLTIETAANFTCLPRQQQWLQL
jgi:hypothetical protein